jgi:hypothetical protein
MKKEPRVPHAKSCFYDSLHDDDSDDASYKKQKRLL